MKKILIVLFLLSNFIFSQEVADRIVAVVGDEIILKSELDLQTAYIAAQNNLDTKDSKIKEQILNKMIEEKLLYAQAERDTIVIDDEQVESRLEGQLQYFIQQYGSEEKVEQVYGMNMAKIRRELRDDVRKSLMSQMVQSKKFNSIDITRREVKEFYDNYQDSLALIPEKFKLSHIFINPQQGSRLEKKAKELALTLLDSIKHGADFAELAKKYSDDPGSAARGGDLGFVKRGVFFPEFEAAAFRLQEGEISDVIKSPVGFHIIQLIARRGEAINARHILIKVKSDDEADYAAIETLNEIRDSIISGVNSFEYFAKKYSDDKETAPLGGDLGSFEVSQLDKTLKDRVYNMQEGEISFPKRLELDNGSYGYHIIRVDKRTAEHIPTYANDYDDIKMLALMRKRQKLYQQWVEELKDKIYWEIRI